MTTTTRRRLNFGSAKNGKCVIGQSWWRLTSRESSRMFGSANQRIFIPSCAVGWTCEEARNVNRSGGQLTKERGRHGSVGDSGTGPESAARAHSGGNLPGHPQGGGVQ